MTLSYVPGVMQSGYQWQSEALEAVLPKEREPALYFGGWIYLASLLPPTYFTHFTLIAAFRGSLVRCEDCQLVSVFLAEVIFAAKSLEAAFSN